MLRSRRLIAAYLAGVIVITPGAGCGSAFNPAFINTFQGGVVPVTPGPNADFILVRGRNDTGQRVEFIVTIEREVLDLDDEGQPIFDDNGDPLTRSVRETVQVITEAQGPANDQGVLFQCRTSPVNIVGLGEDLQPTDAGVFVGGGAAGGAGGIGVSASSVPPLYREAGHFSCGDTIIYVAFASSNVPGGVGLQSYLLPGSEQPTDFSGPNTFENLEGFLESQITEDLP